MNLKIASLVPKKKISHIKNFEYTFKLLDGAPIASRCRPYKINAVKEKLMDEALDKMCKEGILIEKESNWSSQATMLTKKSGKVICLSDYRFLNSWSEIDATPIPDINCVLRNAGEPYPFL